MISVGIDVSKGKSTVCILKPGGEVVKPPFEIEHAVEKTYFHTSALLCRFYSHYINTFNKAVLSTLAVLPIDFS